MAELADALELESSVERRTGSNPVLDIITLTKKGERTMKTIDKGLHNILENADDEQLILLIKTTAKPNIDVFDNESDTIDENQDYELKINPDNGRFALLEGMTIKNQKDRVKNLLRFEEWKDLFNNVSDQGLIDTLNTFAE